VARGEASIIPSTKLSVGQACGLRSRHGYRYSKASAISSAMCFGCTLLRSTI
jgi:hypothetical protein